mgnify:FL=1
MKKIILMLFVCTFISVYSCPDSSIHNNVKNIINNGTIEIHNGKVYFDEIIWNSIDARAKNTWTKAIYIYTESHHKWDVNSGLYGNKSGKKLAEYKYGNVEIY